MNALYISSDDCITYSILFKKKALSESVGKTLMCFDVLSDFLYQCQYEEHIKRYILVRTGIKPILSAIIEDMAEESGQNLKYRDAILESQLVRFFSYLFRDPEIRIEISDQKCQITPLMIDILRYMEDHYADLSMSEMAHAFNYSRGYLSQLIKTSTGRTYMELSTRIRMKKAHDLLLGSSQSVDHIASELGYRDTTPFIRLFKRVYGETPAQHRHKLTTANQ